MKIFILSLPGADNKLMVAKDDEEAFEKRGEVDPSYLYLPVDVKELEVEGYDIHLKAKKKVEEPIPEEEPVETVIEEEVPVEEPPEEPEQAKKKKSQK